jgi:hypothetical protein
MKKYIRKATRREKINKEKNTSTKGRKSFSLFVKL